MHPKPHCLITGGAGFVGSHIANRLDCLGFPVTVLDHLKNGHLKALNKGIAFFNEDVANTSALQKIINSLSTVDIVFHLASFINVKESCLYPEMYYQNNLGGTESILNICKKNGIKKLIFASSGSVYGEQLKLSPFSESVRPHPLSPYSKSKLECENLISKFHQFFDFESVILRYSNVAGASLNGSNGQRTKIPYHVFHRACLSLLEPYSEHTIFGNDYPTKDGTAVRDFIHIEDLINIHLCLLNQMASGVQIPSILNCGADLGLSVKEIFEFVNSASHLDIPIKSNCRRLGDPSYLVSDSSLVKNSLKWSPLWSNPHTLLSSSIHWSKKMRSASLEPIL